MIRTARHGRWTGFELAGGQQRLVVVPELGGKVVSLVDLDTGREWLVLGRPPERLPGPRSLFGGAEAYGWDECLPSVGPGPDPLTPGAPLRDHGDAWGRPATADVGQGLLRITWEGLRWNYRFRRGLSLDETGIVAEYELENVGQRELPFLWAMHPLLSLEPGTRLVLPEVKEVILSYAAGVSLPERTQRLAWPTASLPGTQLALDVVRDARAGSAMKLYAGPLRLGQAAALAPNGDWFGLVWDAAGVPFLGAWLDYGGWPQGHPVHQVALEPTSAPADDLPGATAQGRVWRLPPGGRQTWTVRLATGRGEAELHQFLGG